MNPLTIIFSDINGTLIDFDTYDHAASLPAVQRLQAAGIPLILCSSNNRSEIEPLRKAFQLAQPFIVENGSAIYHADGSLLWQAAERSRIQQVLRAIRASTRLSFETFADIPVERIQRDSGRPRGNAEQAKCHEHSELIVTKLSEKDFTLLRSLCRSHGLDAFRGKQHINVTGPGVNKGTAIQRLTTYYQNQGIQVVTIGIGDNVNDIPMFEVVDRAFLVQLSRERGWAAVDVAGVTRLTGEGPAGFAQIVERILPG